MSMFLLQCTARASKTNYPSASLTFSPQLAAVHASSSPQQNWSGSAWWAWTCGCYIWQVWLEEKSGQHLLTALWVRRLGCRCVISVYI